MWCIGGAKIDDYVGHAAQIGRGRHAPNVPNDHTVVEASDIGNV